MKVEAMTNDSVCLKRKAAVFGSKRHHAKAAEKAEKSYHAAWPNYIPYPPYEPNTPSWLANYAGSNSALNSFG